MKRSSETLESDFPRTNKSRDRQQVVSNRLERDLGSIAEEFTALRTSAGRYVCDLKYR